jgi:capsular polysaccharide biosynthesis protein
LIEKEIRSLRKDKEETEKQIERYRKRIEIGPKIEAMFVDLRRGYEQASVNYQSLLQKKLQSELAENLESTQKGEQFRIIDSANLPILPYKPDVHKLLLRGLMLALGIGFGLAFLREYMDPTFWSRKELESVLKLPVLVAIPNIQTDKERRWKRVKLAATVCVLLAMSSTLGYAMYLLWKKSPGFLPIPL